MAKLKLLWVGDACCPTGFARVTHNIVGNLINRWDVTVLGINYRGDPHPYPYPVYPAQTNGAGDIFGISRLGKVVSKVKPDVIVVNNDPWNVPKFLNQVDVPIVGYMPVDAINMKPIIAASLDKLAMSIFYTKFGMDQATSAGFRGKATVIPHGVNTSLYKPVDRAFAWNVLGLDKILAPEAFIVGNINRNQSRKRLDLTIKYFAEWVSECKLPKNVYLLLHCKLLDEGWDVIQLGEFYGVANRIRITDDPTNGRDSLPEVFMPLIYNSLDVQISTTSGEGWGLTTHEGMACGIPQIVPEFAALGEWPEKSVRYVPVTGFTASTQLVNTISAVPDEDEFIKALDELYVNDELRKEIGAKGYQRAIDGEFEWEAIADLFHLALLEAIGSKTITHQAIINGLPS